MTWPTWTKAVGEGVDHFATAIAAVMAALLGWFNRKKINEVKVSIDGRLEELLKSARSESHSVGRQEGVEAEQQRMRPADPSPPNNGTDK